MQNDRRPRTATGTYQALSVFFRAKEFRGFEVGVSSTPSPKPLDLQRFDFMAAFPLTLTEPRGSSARRRAERGGAAGGRQAHGARRMAEVQGEAFGQERSQRIADSCREGEALGLIHRKVRHRTHQGERNLQDCMSEGRKEGSKEGRKQARK